MSFFDHPLVFVDIETDGGDYRRGHIIEVAVIRVEHGAVTDEFSTIVNPGIAVPHFITNLTGITTNDLQGKPEFDDVAERLLEIMDGAIFVAHNVRFDYSFIKEEFRRIGIEFRPKMFCTVKLSRALHPHIKGHKLSQLIERHGFSYQSRHRAYDDAHVLWQFLQYAKTTFSSEVLDLAIERQLALPSLPRHLDEATMKNLPTGAGVYVFEDEDGVPIYIGKSINIKKRVQSHFTRDTAEYKEFKMAQAVHHVSYIETAGELSALLLESRMIKEQKPVYNRRLRRQQQFIVAKIVRNEDGYDSLEYRQLSDILPDEFDHVMGVYMNRTKAKSAVLTAVKTFDLCPKLCGLEKGEGSCFSYQLKRCRGACIQKEDSRHYNNRLRLAFERTSIEAWPYDSAITVSEAKVHREGLIVDQWRIIGRFTTKSNHLITHPYDAVFDLDAYKILKAFLLHPEATLSIQPFTPERT